ncbi:hypothetical protein BHE74_00053343 [Ensete ventricosum]|nr:hypothetical protein BHE74_00053343 [Ensete ventricosum]
MEASTRTAPACKGGACGHSARRSYRTRVCGARPPTGAATPAAKGVARGQGGCQRRAAPSYVRRPLDEDRRGELWPFFGKRMILSL